MAVCLDNDGVLRDLYYPYIGQENHVMGNKHRVGVWISNRFSWLDSDEWNVSIDYVEKSMVGQVIYTHKISSARAILRTVIYNEVTVLLKSLIVENLPEGTREVRAFFGHEFVIGETKMRNTGFYDPTKNAVIHYKGRRVFLANGQSQDGGISDYTLGMFDYEGKKGSYLDAEDGLLSKNAVEHGPVDSVIAFTANTEGKSSAIFYYWLCAAHSIDDVYKLNQEIIDKPPDGVIHSTTSFWQAWAKTNNLDFNGLPEKIVNTYYNSLFVMRAHLDHKGGVLASLDSGMLQGGKDSYAYVWPRDAAFVAISLDKAGYQSITKRFYEFCFEVLHPDGYLHHKFQPDMSLGSTWHSSIKQKDWLKNKILQLPIQEDEIATVIFGLWQHYLSSNDLEFVETLYKPFIEKAADFMIEFRDKVTKLPIQSYDLWEEMFGISTYTCCAVYGGLTAAAKFANILGKYNHEHIYQEMANEVSEAMKKYLFNHKLNSFVRGIQIEGKELKRDDTIDSSSLFGLWYYEVFDKNDPVFLGTLNAVEEKLHLKTGIGGFCRYENDNYYKDGNSSLPNPWIITTLWEIQRKIKFSTSISEADRFAEELNWVIDRMGDLPVMAEQYDIKTNRPLSASPLTWSHSVFVETVVTYINKIKELKIEAEHNKQ